MIDLLDPQLFARGEAHAAFARLRAEAPAYWNPGRRSDGFWALTRHADVERVLRDPTTFVSSRGIAPDPAPDARLPSRVLTLMDPPRHTELRRQLAPPFAPRAVAERQGEVRAIVETVIARVAPHGQADFVREVASPIALTFLFQLLGIPRADWPHVGRLIDRRFFAEPDADARARLSGELLGYLEKLVARKASDPGDDVISHLVSLRDALPGGSFLASTGNANLSERDAVRNTALLLDAGVDTTRNLLSLAMHALLEHDDARHRLTSDPSVATTAVEELIRWASPIVQFARVAAKDVELHGVKIFAGQRVALYFASANRDEAVFGDDRLDLGRSPNPHLGFGAGEHFCLGASVARLAMVTTIGGILTFLPDLALDGPIERIPSVFNHGLRRMPVRFTPRG